MPKERPQTTKLDNGGPAFPVLAYDYSASGDIRPNPAPMQYEGMTLRDWFAGMAMQALVTSHEYGAQLQRIYDADKAIANLGTEKESPQEYTARIAYSLAVGMLKARGQ